MAGQNEATPPHIRTILDTLRSRARRVDQHRRDHLTHDNTGSYIRSRFFGSIPMIRSEERVAAELLPLLLTQIDILRDQLTTKGTPFTNSEDYQEDLETGVHTQQSAENRLALSTTNFYVEADTREEDAPSRDKRKLFLSGGIDGETDIMLNFGFPTDEKPNGTVEIDFSIYNQQTGRVTEYRTEEVALEEITPEEYPLIMRYVTLALQESR